MNREGERDQWLERRTFAWGGSEVAALMACYGLVPFGESIPAWMRAQVEHYRTLGVPKLLAWKAGLRAEPKGDVVSMQTGARRERELLDRFARSLAPRRVDPATIRHADDLPAQFFPMVDRRCHRLAVTPDAWAVARRGGLVMIELKCTYQPSSGRLRWHHRCQLQAEIAACAADFGLVVVGEQWVDDSVPDGPVRAFGQPRDETLIAQIRAAAVEGWSLVEALREIGGLIERADDEMPSKAAAARWRRECRARAGELWQDSRRRLAELVDPTARQLDAVLEQVDGIDEILGAQTV